MAKNKKNEVAMDIRSLQKPLKEQYRNDPNASQITIRAKSGQTDVPVACSVDIGRALYHAEAHKGVGGGGTGACSGDLLLEGWILLLGIERQCGWKTAGDA